MATFIIKKTFKISIRNSTVFLGDIVSGTVKVGQIIKLKPTDNHRGLDLKISGIDYADSISKGTTQIGLTVAPINQRDTKELDDLRIEDEQVEIEEV